MDWIEFVKNTPDQIRVPKIRHEKALILEEVDKNETGKKGF